MTFIFDRCHRSWAAETPAKYERDLKYVIYYCDKSKFSVTDKLTNGALVTPIPDTQPVAINGVMKASLWLTSETIIHSL